MGRTTLTKDKLAEVVSGVLESGAIRKDMTIAELLKSSSEMSGPEVAWTAVVDGDKWVIVMP